MLEFSSNKFELNLTIFPKAIVFLQGFSEIDFINLIFAKETRYNFFSVSKIKFTFLKNYLLLLFKNSSSFSSQISVTENLQILERFFIAKHLKNILIGQFQLNAEILNKSFQDVSDEEKFLLSLTPVFLKDVPIWCIFVEDEILSDFRKELLKAVFLSKVSNSNSIVFYVTRSNKSLDLKNEIVLEK
jgi:hypothetical protein